jgi:hypothetical protein
VLAVVLTVNSDWFPNGIKPLFLLLPVKYEMKYHIVSKINSVFEWLIQIKYTSGLKLLNILNFFLSKEKIAKCPSFVC